MKFDALCMCATSRPIILTGAYSYNCVVGGIKGESAKSHRGRRKNRSRKKEEKDSTKTRKGWEKEKKRTEEIKNER